MTFSSTQPDSRAHQWRSHLDKFVQQNQRELAALFWGLWLKNSDSQGTIGIDLQPTPHFVYCPKAEIEKLNHKVDHCLQEILGIIDNHQPEVEVVMIGIGRGEIKLIQFAPQPTPPICFEQVSQDVDSLLELLEQRMSEHFPSQNS
jgi:hypothetical protein